MRLSFFFQFLDKQLGHVLTEINLRKHQGELFVFVEKMVRGETVGEWKRLFEVFLSDDDEDLSDVQNHNALYTCKMQSIPKGYD